MSAQRGSRGDRAADDVTSVLLSGGTYRTLAEQVLSPAEERFERARRTAGFVLAPLVAVAVLLAPLELRRRSTGSPRSCSVSWCCGSANRCPSRSAG